MESYMVRELGLDIEKAKTLRSDFWHNHGTTLEGLVQVHGVDPDPFLEEVHDIDHSNLVHAAHIHHKTDDLATFLTQY